MSKPATVRIEVMTGESGITDQDRNYNRNLVLGCGALFLFAAIGLCGILTLAFAQDRQAAKYPGAASIASHSNYKGLPREYRWDDTYLTTDNFTTVYNWYSIKFDLGAEARALEKCTQLEGSTTQLMIKRHLTVSLCNMPQGQMIFVTRSTSIR